VGQSSITTLGTIATGVWNGTDIALADGGTNASLTASDGGIVYSTATAMAILSGVATAGRILISGATAAPTWLATANGGVLTTDPSTGAPTIDTTNFVRLSTGMQVRGNNAATAPPAGFIGQQIRNQVAEGAVSLAVTGTFYTVTSIDLTPGIWDISFVCKITQQSSGTAARCQAGIATATNSNTGWVQGDNAYDSPPPLFNQYGRGISIPAYRVLVSSTTTYFLTANAGFTSGTYAAGGRLSAVRVG
jgi:hypothetical protein